jgi:fimbrial isopeptide formation D2 family protein
MLPQSRRNDVIAQVPVSVNRPAVLSNLWTGEAHEYTVRELGDYNSTYVFKKADQKVISTDDSITFATTDSSHESMVLTITNEFEHRPGSLSITKQFNPAGFHSEYNVDNDTIFRAIVQTGNNEYLTFNAQNVYTGTTASRAAASRAEFSVNSPVVITGIPTPSVLTIEEIFDNEPYAAYVMPTYSDNNRSVAAGECFSVVITNMFKHRGTDISIHKQLDDFPAEWGVNNDTIFHTTLQDVTDNAHLVFRIQPDGTYRCVGHLACNSADCTNTLFNGVCFSDPAGDGNYLSLIEFSVNNPALISNLWPGRDYAIVETDADDYRVDYTYVNQLVDDLLSITVTNSPRIFSVNYHPNWPQSARRAGDVPPPHSGNRRGTVVEVAHNPSNLHLSDWVLLGWAHDPTDSTPDYPLNNVISNSFIMPPTDVDLYAVWVPRPLVRNVHKEAVPRNFLPDVNAPISYSISFNLPVNLSYCDVIRISDTFSPTDLTFTGITSLSIDGHTVVPPPAFSASGQVDVVLDSSHFAGHDGKEVILTLEFTVNNGATGIIRNTANVFVKTLYEYESSASDGSDTEIIVEVPYVGIKYDPNWPGGISGSGSVPSDDNTYDLNTSATIRGNDGNLQKSGYTFMGWSRTRNGEVEFPADSPDNMLLITTDSSVTLYGVWRFDIDVTKTASSQTYQVGGTVRHSIKFTMPIDTSEFEQVKIEDVIPHGLTYVGGYRLYIGDYDATEDIRIIAGIRNGSLTRFVVIDGDLLTFSQGREIELRMRFGISNSASGDISNTANVYFTRYGDDESDTPDGSTSSIIVQEGSVTTTTGDESEPISSQSEPPQSSDISDDSGSQPIDTDNTNDSDNSDNSDNSAITDSSDNSPPHTTDDSSDITQLSPDDSGGTTESSPPTLESSETTVSSPTSATISSVSETPTQSSLPTLPQGGLNPPMPLGYPTLPGANGSPDSDDSDDLSNNNTIPLDGNPRTGITLAIVPMLISAGIMAVSRKRK